VFSLRVCGLVAESVPRRDDCSELSPAERRLPEYLPGSLDRQARHNDRDIDVERWRSAESVARHHCYDDVRTR